MVNFGYPYNDIVICKDSTDYLGKDHNGNKQDLSAFCAIPGYICNNVQHRIIVLYIAE